MSKPPLPTAACAAVIVLLLGSPSQGAPALKDVFEAHEHRYTGGQYHEELFRYRLFVPRNLNPGQRYPLLVWLHGLGENDADNERSLCWLALILNDLDHVDKYRFFILVVQCPAANPYWSRGSTGVSGGKTDDMVDVAFEILQKTMREQPVDQNRVYLSGVSSGGSGCWEMVTRYPGTFAAVAPLASGGGDGGRVARLVNVPIWAVHNDKDEGTPPDGVIQTVGVLKSLGGNVHLTLLKARGHDCWTAAFRKVGVMEWMLEQRRDSWICWRPPGGKPRRWWHVFAVPAGFLAFVVAGWCSERRRRRLRRVLRRQAAKTCQDG